MGCKPHNSSQSAVNYGGEDSGLINGHGYVLKQTIQIKKGEKSSNLIFMSGMNGEDEWVYR